MYIEAAIKIFGCWTSDLAQRWDDDDLPEVKQVAQSMSTRLRDLAGSQHIEVQERVSMNEQPFRDDFLIARIALGLQCTPVAGVY